MNKNIFKKLMMVAACLALTTSVMSYANGDNAYKIQFSVSGFVGETIKFSYTMGDIILGPNTLTYGVHINRNYQGNSMSIVQPILYQNGNEKSQVYEASDSCKDMAVSPNNNHIIFSLLRTKHLVTCRVTS